MKQMISTLALIVFLSLPSIVWAEEVCVQNYGQPVVCGTKTPEYHVPVQAGLGDIDFRIVGIGFMAIAGVIYTISARKSSL